VTRRLKKERAQGDHHPKVEVMPPNTTSPVQPMNTGVTANIKTYYLHKTLVACSGGYGMRLKSKKTNFSKRCHLYNAALNIAEA
jgi:hypothetical protein